MARWFGDEALFIVGGGGASPFVVTGGIGAAGAAAPAAAGVAPGSPAAGAQPAFKFDQMFPALTRRRALTDDRALIQLGQAMETTPITTTARDQGDHPDLPAGYTYLAQFITHDISFDLTRQVPDGQITPADLVQGRSPSLDLDSVYGDGPDSADSRLYQDDRIKLKVGLTQKSLLGEDANAEFSNDLPRDAANAQNPRQALTADPRNDENLAVAQTHVAFLRFHNAVVDLLAATGLAGRELFEEARKKVVQHYQWIVLHDFLPRIIDKDVLADVLANGPQNFKPGQVPFMPVEFAFAAFRLGHSIVRDAYEWNRVFQSPKNGTRDIARMHRLTRFTGRSGTMEGNLRLPSNWIIDWTRFFDFTGFAGIANNPKSNKAKRIDTNLSQALKFIPGFLAHIDNKDFRSLAVLDLVRGNRLGLPAGQDIAGQFGVTALSPVEVAEGKHESILKANRLDANTPLWYYILKEAETVHLGERLGPVGSRLVAETLVGLIQASQTTILPEPKTEPHWRPDLGQIRPDQFAMPDLLVLADVVNPLG